MNDLKLCTNPRQELERHYYYLGLPYYEGHDFNNVEQIKVEDDEIFACLVITPLGDRCSPGESDDVSRS